MTAIATNSNAQRSARLEPSPLLNAHPAIAVLRTEHASAYGPVVETLVEHGVRSIELTLSTPGTLEALPELLESFGEVAEIGVGTILSDDQAEAAAASGAHYLVTPAALPGLAAVAARWNIRTFPAGLTPTEVITGWNAGATAVKLFPASLVGPGYVSQLRGPFPDVRLMPSGGVRIEDVPAWLRAGVTAVSLGSPLLGDALEGGSMTALAERTKRLLDAIRSVRP